MKRIISIIGLIVLTLVSLNFFNKYYSKEKKVEDSLLAFYVESDDGNYHEEKSIPIGEYLLDEEKTFCENNGTIIEYDSILGTIKYKINGSDKCYVYFAKNKALDNNYDILEALDSYNVSSIDLGFPLEDNMGIVIDFSITEGVLISNDLFSFNNNGLFINDLIYKDLQLDNSRHTLVLGKEIYLDNELIGEISLVSDSNLVIFNDNTDANLYKVTIRRNNVVSNDYVPVFDNLNERYGLLDQINNIFY